MSTCKNEDDCPTPMWCRVKDKCPKADERGKKYGVLGFHYRVIPPKGNLWCAMCGHWTDHQSGTCPELLPPNAQVQKCGPDGTAS